jgi:hypothetical protein
VPELTIFPLLKYSVNEMLFDKICGQNASQKVMSTKVSVDEQRGILFKNAHNNEVVIIERRPVLEVLL